MGRRTRSQEWRNEETLKLMQEFCDNHTDAEVIGEQRPSLITPAHISKEALQGLTNDMAYLREVAKRTDEMAKGKHRKEWEKALEIAKVEVKLGV